jgi:hypothetical protein
MPRLSERGLLIENLEKIKEERLCLKEFREAVDSSDEDEDDIDDLVDFQLQTVKSNRYLKPRPVYRKGNQAFEEDLDNKVYDSETGAACLPWLTESEFQQKYRVTRDSFDIILGLIKDHPVFTDTKGTGRKQTDPACQLMTLLKYLGTQGTGGSNLDLRSIFKIGRGTAHLFRNRAMVAL